MHFQKISYLAFVIAFVFGIASTNANPDEGCCTHDYKKCINWCGGDPHDKNACLKCNHHDGVAWLENGPPKDKCAKRWVGCKSNPNKCCPGLECRPNENNWPQCLPALSTPEPTAAPTAAPTKSHTEPPQNDKQGCCSHNYKHCINWCGGNPHDKNACLNCNHHDGVAWLENGAPEQKCAKRWVGCKSNPNKCCPGLVCRPNENNWPQCLPEE